MNLRIEKQYVNKYPFKGGIAESRYNIFLKKTYLQVYNSRLLINANNKFNTLLKDFILAWSYRSNEKAYVNRRQILRRNSRSSY